MHAGIIAFQPDSLSRGSVRFIHAGHGFSTELYDNQYGCMHVYYSLTNLNRLAIYHTYIASYNNMII